MVRVLKDTRVLVAEADPERLALVSEALRRAGATVISADDGAAVYAHLHGEPVRAVVAAAQLPDVAGSDVAGWSRALDAGPPVVLTAVPLRLAEARRALECGAHAYVAPECAVDALVQCLERDVHDAAAAFAGTSEAARRVRREIRALAASPEPVLVTGETGSGKEVVARALHRTGSRREGPFVPVNCGALPESLVEGELFGALRGSYTGAVRDRQGLLEAAAGGTLFLDEVGELPPPVQVALLRVLDGGGVRPLGATRERAVDVRVVAATHRDLGSEVARGRFREDLHFRLDVLRIHVPPLRERVADIPLLAQAFAEAPLRAEVLRELLGWRWPGNVRELAAAVRRAAVSEGGVVRRVAVSCDERGLDRRSLDALLRRHRGDVRAAARSLGVSVRTVQRRLARAGLRAAAYRRGGAGAGSFPDPPEICIASDM